MSVNGIGTAGYPLTGYGTARTKEESNQIFTLGTATREAAGNGDGKNIGVMAIGNQAYLAQYSENSTPANPIVKVGGYEISVNDVDPENATEIEMFALMSHLDKTGQSQNEGMSSFSKMRTYSRQVECSGFCSGIADADEAWNRKRDWTEMIENARKIYSQSSIPEIYALTGKCAGLLDVMRKWIESRMPSEVYQNNKASQAAESKSSENAVTNITLHGIMGEKTETGDTVVGAWGNA